MLFTVYINWQKTELWSTCKLSSCAKTLHSALVIITRCWRNPVAVWKWFVVISPPGFWTVVWFQAYYFCQHPEASANRVAVPLCINGRSLRYIFHDPVESCHNKTWRVECLSLSMLGESGHRISTAEGILCMLGYEARDVICIANSQMCAIWLARFIGHVNVIVKLDKC